MKLKMQLKDNQKDYDYVQELIALAILEKKKIVIVLGGTTIASYKPRNWVINYILDTVVYTKIIAKVCEDRIKIYFNGKKEKKV